MYVLAPDRVQVPASCLVTVPVVVPMMEVRLPPCAPPRVKPKLAPVIVPTFVKAIVPVPPTIELALPRVTSPAYEAALPLFIKAPPELIPVPLMVRASSVPNM